MSDVVRVLCLVPYPVTIAGVRLRFARQLDSLARNGVRVTPSPLLDEVGFADIFRQGHLLGTAFAVLRGFARRLRDVVRHSEPLAERSRVRDDVRTVLIDCVASLPLRDLVTAVIAMVAYGTAARWQDWFRGRRRTFVGDMWPARHPRDRLTNAEFASNLPSAGS